MAQEEPQVVTIELDPDDASHVAQMLHQLGALVDPDDPDGLTGVFGDLRSALTTLALREDQLRLLDPLVSHNNRAQVARRLRRLSATIEEQLPRSAAGSSTSGGASV